MSFSKTDLKHIANVLADTNNGLTSSKIIKYFCYFGFKYKVDIPCNTQPFYDVVGSSRRSLNKAGAFERNLLAFSDAQQLIIIHTLSQLPKFENNPLVKEIITRNTLKDPNIIYLESHSVLDKYPDVKSLYLKAVKYIELNETQDKRNILDDLRLSIELLLRHIFNNNLPLEKQRDEFTTYITDQDIPDELKGAYQKIFNNYIEYQNKNVKHNLPTGDLDLQIKTVLNMTNMLMTLFI